MPTHRLVEVRIVLLFAVFMTSQRARAQSEQAIDSDAGPTDGPTDASAIVPPRMDSPAAVPYPDGAHGDALVVLTLTIGAEGAVEDARAAEGEEPFSTAAETAARGWHFEPAERDGQPVAARIRFEVRFHEPAPEPAPPSPDAGAPSGPEPPERAEGAPLVTDAGPPSRPAPPSPEEVTIRASRAPPQATSLTHAEVRQLPGAFGDPFRAIEAMPGVTPIVSGLPFFYVRGAPPGNVGYFLDGVRVPYLFHVGLGPAVIHPGLVDRVDLYSGGYPAAFGRFAGGVVSAETTAPRPDFHGEGNVRVFDLGTLVETGFADGRGTALVAARYSYTAAILSLIAQDVQLDYRDYEARISYDFTPRDRVTVFSFGAYDLLAQKDNGQTNVLFGSEFYRLDVRYDHRFESGTRLRAAVTLGFDQTKIPGQPRNTKDDLIGARLEVTQPIAARTALRTGIDATRDAYRADFYPYSDPDDPDTRRLDSLFPPRNDLAIAGYLELAYRSDDFELTPGLRIDWFRSGGATAVSIDPRLMTRVRLADGVHVVHAFGIAHQPPSFVIPVPGLAIGDLQGGLQTALQSSAGVEIDLPEATTATVTLFDNIFLHMSDTLGVRQPGDDTVLSDTRSLGSAIGAELYVRRRLSRRLGGFLSYTLSRSTRSLGPDHFPSAFDRTHVLSAALAFDLGRNWRAGARLTLYSGTPKVASTGGLVPPPRDPDPPRDPFFYRLDLRLEKRWQLSATAWFAVVAEMMNATLNEEVVVDQTIGPVTIPSLGFEAAF